MVVRFFKRRSRFELEIRKWIEGRTTLSFENQALSDVRLTSVADADALNDAFLHLLGRPLPPSGHGEWFGSDLHRLIEFLDTVETSNAVNRISTGTLPLLERIVAGFDADESRANEAVIAFKQFIAYGYLPGIALVANCVRRGLFVENLHWKAALKGFASCPELGVEFVTGLGDILPSGLCGVGYLDMINALCRDRFLSSHPFDSEVGSERLAAWLAPSEDRSYGVSACAALPFLVPTRRAALFRIACTHPDVVVRIEAYRAMAASGEESGLENLSRMTCDPIFSLQAIKYLQEFGADEWIPEKARDPAFQAHSEMVNWLSHTMEYGRPPDAIGLLDRRTMVWPPIGDAIETFLFSYRYDDGDTVEEGVGMVGSVTFALYGETDIAGMSPEDIYGLHCCWELERNSDPRCPESRTAEYGRSLLARANPGKEF